MLLISLNIDMTKLLICPKGWYTATVDTHQLLIYANCRCSISIDIAVLLCCTHWYAISVDTPFLSIHLLCQYALSVSSPNCWYPISVDTPYPLMRKSCSGPHFFLLVGHRPQGGRSPHLITYECSFHPPLRRATLGGRGVRMYGRNEHVSICGKMRGLRPPWGRCSKINLPFQTVLKWLWVKVWMLIVTVCAFHV